MDKTGCTRESPQKTPVMKIRKVLYLNQFDEEGMKNFAL